MPAMAQDQAADPTQVTTADTDDTAAGGDIVVTGTRIVRPNNRSAAPIVTTTAAEIAAQGATTIEEVLNRLPQVQVNSEQNFSDSEGRQRIKLRSLGYERTLTLIDGLRVGLANTVDVGIIPTALVERIDVLTGGASSVYGSDAVSGVVNFVLKKNFEGIRLDANYSFFNHDNRANDVTDAVRRAGFNSATGMANDGGRADVSLAAGVNLFDNKVNISGFVNYRESSIVRLRDRSFSQCEVVQPSNTAVLSCSRASYTPAGTIIPQAGAQAGQILVNNPNGNGTFIPINSGPAAASANPYDDWAFQRPFERLNFGGFLTAQISDHVEFYSTALFYRDKSYNTQLNRNFSYTAYGDGDVPFRVNCDNPFLSTSQAQTLCGANAGAAGQFAPLDVRYRFDGLPLVEQKFTNEGYRIVAGLRGRVLDDVWSYDLAGMISRAQLDTIDVPFAQFDNINRSLDVVNVGGRPTCRSVVNGTDPSCVPFNAFTPFNQDAALNNYLFGGGDTGGISTRIPRLLQFVGSVSGDLGKYGITSPFAEQGLAIALGGEYREEMERTIVNEIYQQNNPGGPQNQRFTQSILEGNIELQAPLVEDQSWTKLLQLNAGYRLSKYNRLEGKFGTWKVEGIWSPVSDIIFRGSYNKSQAAPGVGAAAGAANIFWNQGFYADPCAPQINPANPGGPRNGPSATIEQCRNTGLPDNLYGSTTLICPDDRCTVREGGFDLAPESAFTTTIGVVLRPRFIPGLTVSVDRWLIDLEDQLTFLNPSDWINECLNTGNDYFCRGIVRAPNGTLSSSPASSPSSGWVSRGSVNGYKSQSHGWDFQGQYNVGLGGAGSLDMGFNGTLMTRVGSQGAPTVEPRDCTGYFGNGCGESMPTWAHQFRTTWTTADRVASVSLNWRHRSGMPMTVYAPADTGIPDLPDSDRRDQYPGIKAYDWFDLALSFDVNKQMTFRVAANNIFDRDPPLVPDSRARIGLLRGNTIMGYDLLGRQIVAGISLRL
ncbi:hypothetical protein E5A73_09465 [Sphingomonas gei]|uniref:TonB-dependent receptor plug domain-containing protein n=2 Tax=Sphingomonas gei TaxID=1395960 RepID=A0A4S1XF81_9SPHN|nr:hypothetical protein E5A73_09465 [Sphingomonas gei]